MRTLHRAYGRPSVVLVAVVLIVALLPATPAAAAATWLVVPSPSPSTIASALNDVTVISSTNAWAVGYAYDNNLAAYRTLTLRFDGARWTRVTSLNADTGYNQLDRVDATAANDVWALGTAPSGTLVHRWNGTRWAAAPRPSVGGLRGLDAVSPTDVWAVGGTTVNGIFSPVVTRWNGSSWRTIPTIPGATRHLSTFEAVAARTPTDVWAVGWDRDYSISSKPVSSLVAHWNGTAWTRLPSPNPNSRNFLYDVVPLAADDVWAVGISQVVGPGITQSSLVMHWNGRAWSVVPAPAAEPGADGQLHGLAAVSATSLWAVGYYYSPSAQQHEPLLMHWDGARLTVNPGPETGTPSTLWGVSALANGTVWAVGYNSVPGSADTTLTMRTTQG